MRHRVIVPGTLHRVEDMYTRDRSTPQPDRFYLGSDSVTGAAGAQVDGFTTIAFRKKIKGKRGLRLAAANDASSEGWRFHDLPDLVSNTFKCFEM